MTGILVDDTQKEIRSIKHPVIFCPAVAAYSSFPASFLPLKEDEISKWAKIQLERATNSFVSSCAYLKIADYVLAAGISSPLPKGLRVTFPHLVAIWHHYHQEEMRNPALYLFACDAFSAVLSVTGMNVKGYYKVSPERTRDALYEALMLARRQEGGDRLKVYSNIEIEGAEQIHLEEVIRDLPPSAFLDTRNRVDKIRHFFVERPQLVSGILLGFSVVFLLVNVFLGVTWVKGTEKLSRKQALRTSFMSLRDTLGDLNPIKYECLNIFSPEYNLPVRLNSAEINSRECTIDVRFYAFTSSRKKELLSCVEQGGGKYESLKEGDWHVIAWHVSNPKIDCFKNLEETSSFSPPVPSPDRSRPGSPAPGQELKQKDKGSGTKPGKGTELPGFKTQTNTPGSVSSWCFFCNYAYAAELDTHRDGTDKKGRVSPLPDKAGSKGSNVPVPSGAGKVTSSGEGNISQERKTPGSGDSDTKHNLLKRNLLKEDKEAWLKEELRRLEKKLNERETSVQKTPLPLPSGVDSWSLKKRIWTNPGGYRIGVIIGAGEVFVLSNGIGTLLLSRGDTFSYAGDVFTVKKWSKTPLMVVLENEDASAKVVFTSLSADIETPSRSTKKSEELPVEKAEKPKAEVQDQKDTSRSQKSNLPPTVNFPPVPVPK